MKLRVLICVLICMGCKAVNSQGEITTTAKTEATAVKEMDPLATEASAYVGSKVCAGCHPENYEGWKTTLHSKMIQETNQPGALVADFGKQDISTQFSLNDVDLLVGGRFKQRFMKKIGDDYYMLPIQWNVATKEWVRYFPRDEWWVSQYPEDWQKRPTSKLCDGCHSTSLIGRGGKTPAEWNIACEACHGPGAGHVVAEASLGPGQGAGAKIINPAKLPFDRANDVCFQCHLAGRPPEGSEYPDRDYPVGYLPGDDLTKYKNPAPSLGMEGPESHEFFEDGISKKNRNQGNDFIRSKMYSRGIRCFDCHNPHSGKYTAMVYKPGNSLCLTCHSANSPAGPPERSISEHTHHKADSPGSQCIECHMPRIGKHAVKLESRSHCFDFDFVSPERTILYDHPNACNRCHQDKTTEWALRALKNWGGKGKWKWQRALQELREQVSTEERG
ncbi:MAG: cytochrome c3 family protein [Candidatus Brocadiales bacterium]|nr:cytochrome c3 family protein [Candidatus Brocadiales bacterium]MDO8137880.1 cytochrome c3 family protein [Candidatus Brocadiales bacterium]